MQINEYQEFDMNRNEKISCVQENVFCGITPKFIYSQSYLTNNNPGVVIEFKTKRAGWLYGDFTTAHNCRPKAEAGTSSYGLGRRGISESCDVEYK
ncbi:MULTISPECIES: hypothetical protein [Photorhabdus]|nr:hypothetical protein [Photorhabdus luminescens]